MKAELNKDNRIKCSENYENLRAIEQEISARIRSEYTDETLALRNECDKYVKEEKAFYEEVKNVLLKCDITTKLKVVTQTGKNSTVLNTYVGTLEKNFDRWGGNWFNFISSDRNNDCRPFTIGFSCLQSIEVLEECNK